MSLLYYCVDKFELQKCNIYHFGFLRMYITESPLRNILGMYLLLVTADPFLPFLGI
jgi:hypothetical protein